MTYWEAADILEHGSLDYGEIREASAIAIEGLKEKVRRLKLLNSEKYRLKDLFMELNLM